MGHYDLIDKFFNPKSIALIGASRKPFGAAHTIMTAILHKRYPGEIYLVNASAQEGEKLFDLPLYKRLQDCPKVDLVFIIVPSRYVKSVIEDCIECKVANGIIISSGFKESILYDQKKVELEKEIVELARTNGLRLIGPNCNGIVNIPASFYAFFGPRLKVPIGPLSVVSRGGTASGFILMGSSIFGRGLGINKLVNLGDACDLTIGDFLTYYGEDEQTKVIGVYSEGIQDGPEFLKVIKKMKKPVILYKSGQSEAGQRAALSHVGALASSSTNAIYQGFLAQSGAIPANSVEEMLDIAAGFSHSILPYGNKIGIFTFGGSLGVMMTDAAEKQGLSVAPLKQSQVDALNQMLPEYWSHSNPVDVTDGSSVYEAQNLMKIFQIILQEFDALFIIAPVFENVSIFDYTEKEINFQSMYKTFIRQNIKRFGALVQNSGKPIFVLGEFGELSNLFYQNGIPVYDNFDRMAKAYAGLYRYALHLKRNETRKK